MRDIVLIGSGLGGLVAALSLAKKNFKISIYEQDTKLGGYAGDFVRKKQGFSFSFDISLHNIGDLAINRALYLELCKLGIYEKIKPFKKQNFGYFYHNDKKLLIPADASSFCELLCSIFPDKNKKIKELFIFLKNFDEQMQDSLINASLPKSLFKLQDISLDEFLDEYLDEEGKELFACLWTYFGCVKEEINAYFYLVAWCSYFYGGCFYLEGGSKSLVEALEDELLKQGVKIYKNTKISDILLADDYIKGVYTDKNELIKADYFIFNAPPSLFFKSKIKQDPLSFTLLYIGLCEDVKSFGIHENVFKRYKNSQKEELAAIKNSEYEQMSFGITSYENPQGGILVLAMPDLASNWPPYKSKAYKDQKEKIKLLLLDKLYKYFPNAKDKIIYSSLATPHTLEFYTKNPKGAVYGYDQNIKNAGFKRQGLMLAKNAFLANAWTMPGGGYEGSMLAGLNAAKAVAEFAAFKPGKILSQKAFLNAMAMQGIASKEYKGCFYFLLGNQSYKIAFKDTKARLETIKKEELSQANTPSLYIKCQNESLQALCSGDLSPQTLLNCKLISLKGDVEAFWQMRELFPKPKPNLSIFDRLYERYFVKSKDQDLLAFKKQVSKKLLKSYGFLLSLLPFILYWLGSAFFYINPVGFLFFSIFYSLFFLPFFSLKITLLDKSVILAFSINVFLPSIASFILPFVFFISVLLKQPLSCEYLESEKGHFYLKIHSMITLAFGMSFLIQSLVLALNPGLIYIYFINIAPFIFKHFYLKAKGF